MTSGESDFSPSLSLVLGDRPSPALSSWEHLRLTFPTHPHPPPPHHWIQVWDAQDLLPWHVQNPEPCSVGTCFGHMPTAEPIGVVTGRMLCVVQLGPWPWTTGAGAILRQIWAPSLPSRGPDPGKPNPNPLLDLKINKQNI